VFSFGPFSPLQSAIRAQQAQIDAHTKRHDDELLGLPPRGPEFGRAPSHEPSFLRPVEGLRPSRVPKWLIRWRWGRYRVRRVGRQQ